MPPTTDTEYDCEGCGIHIYRPLGIPLHGFCAMCEWLCENIEPANIMTIQRNQPGYESERSLRHK